MLRINSSEIAMVTGYHTYCNQDKYLDLFVKYLYSGNDKMKQSDNIEYLNNAEQINKILSINNKKEMIDQCLNTDITDTTILNEQISKINDIVDTIDSVDKNKMKAELTNRLNHSYGNLNESKAIKHYEKISNTVVYDNNKTYYHKKFSSFIICGRIDGLVNKEGVIYINEVKNRRNYIFESIPLYEIIQILVYSKITDISNIIFTQCKDDECKIETFKNFSDDELWENLLTRLTDYTELIYGLRNMHTLRKEFLKLSNNRKYKYLCSKLKWNSE